MRRWAWRILVAASAVLLIAAAALWARAQQARDAVWVQVRIGAGPRAADEGLKLVAQRDALALAWVTWTLDLSDPAVAAAYRETEQSQARFRFESYPPDGAGAEVWEGGDAHASWRRWGFGWATMRFLPPDGPPSSMTTGEGDAHAYDLHQWTTTAAFVPWWFLTLIFALAPARALWAWRNKRRRRPAHLCRGCGYDLRATADAGGPRWPVCPECGRASDGA